MVDERMHLHLLCERMVSSSALTMAPFVLVTVVALFIGPFFLYFLEVGMDTPCMMRLE